MNIVFFGHPDLLGSQSMPRFQNMLVRGMAQRGHAVTVLKPSPVLSALRAPHPVRKWLGYFDQYIVFPEVAKRKIRRFSSDTLFVFTDHALGPWVRLVGDRPHVIHCHDFLAQRSAYREIPQNRVGWTGRVYQAMIRRGFLQGRNFISVSAKTRDDLHSLLTADPLRSEIVYNGLNQSFSPRQVMAARSALACLTRINLLEGYILHVGGNQWYKNRRGVIEIYQEWRTYGDFDLPLLMVGKKPDKELLAIHRRSPYREDIHWIENLPDRLLPDAYSGATVLLFPSLAEGFGWPIAEAMACGCPVITTGLPPMTEVSGDSAFLIPPRPDAESEVKGWAVSSAQVLNSVVTMNGADRQTTVEKGLLNAKRFDTDIAINHIEKIYRNIMGLFPGPTLSRRSAMKTNQNIGYENTSHYTVL